jgi:hypothetical protein
VFFALAVVAWQEATLSALAGPAADAHTDESGIETQVRDGDDAGALPGEGKKKDSPPLRCELSELDPENVSVADRLAQNGWGPPKGEEPGRWMRRRCYLQNGNGAFGDVIWVRDNVDPLALAQEARDRLPLPAPLIRMSPPASRPQVVNGPSTWLAIDPETWRSLTSSVSAGGVTVTARAEPLRVRWEMGTGDTVVCSGPGQMHDGRAESSPCSYVWPRRSSSESRGRFLVTVTIEWRATWTVEGAPGGGDLGSVMRSSTVEVEVVERRAVNTKS